MEQATWVIGDLVTVDDGRLTDMHGKDFPVVAVPTSEVTIIDASSVNESSAYYIYNYRLKLKEAATMTNDTTAVATVNNEEVPKVWAVEVQFPYTIVQQIPVTIHFDNSIIHALCNYSAVHSAEISKRCRDVRVVK